jgi:DnaJ-class molecular chaperone
MSKKQIISLFLTLIILPQIITEEDFYTLLGVSRQATQKEIKKAFRTLSLKYHPDRNPNDKKAHDLYLRINKAHEVLTDPDKKRIYDIYGEEGLNKESELMREDLEKGPDARADITVSLEDLYNGS